MFNQRHCHRGHVIRGPRDIRSNGVCAECSRENEARYRCSLRDARRRMQAIEAALVG